MGGALPLQKSIQSESEKAIRFSLLEFDENFGICNLMINTLGAMIDNGPGRPSNEWGDRKIYGKRACKVSDGLSMPSCIPRSIIFCFRLFCDLSNKENAGQDSTINIDN